MSQKQSSPRFNLFSDFLWQMLPVMLGVFLGLWGNNLNEGRKQKNLETKVLEKIIQDVESNKKQLENVLDYHQSLGDTANVLLENSGIEILNKSMIEIGRNPKYFFWRGTRTGRLRDAAYQTAVVSGVLAELDVDLMVMLSEINQNQLSYNEMANNYLQTAIDRRMDFKLVDRLIFISTFSTDITIAERNLIKLYKVALEKLK